MKIDASRAKSLVEALQSVQSRVAKASAGRNVRHVTPLLLSSLSSMAWLNELCKVNLRLKTIE